MQADAFRSFLKWSAFVLSLIGPFADRGSPWILKGLALIGTWCAFVSLTQGKVRLLTNLDEFGIKDPLQGLVVMLFGFFYFVGAATGWAAISQWSRGLLADPLPVVILLAGNLFFAPAGAILAFGYQPDEKD